MEPLMGDYTLFLGDCLEIMPGLEDNSVDLIATDPPYFKVKGEYWDRQWDTPAGFITWIGQLCEQWQRILKPNGSLYVFASPRMAARVEVKIGEWFNVLNHIVWPKSDQTTHALKYGDDRFRLYVQKSERLIFAEHFGADNIAKGEAGYEAKCDQLRGFVFEPLRAYLEGERNRAGISFEQVRQIVGCASGSGLPSHWFTRSQWILPTEEHYLKMREGFSRLNHGGSYLRREYEDLRREYEDLRRPFQVSAEVPYTDVWAFPTVGNYPGKHPCEKPVAMMEHIINVSSKPGAMVLDCTFGSCTTGVAAIRNERRFIGIEKDPGYFEIGKNRMAAEAAKLSNTDLPLFTEAIWNR